MKTEEFAQTLRESQCASQFCDPTYVPHNPIYEAPIEVRLKDLKHVTEEALEMLPVSPYFRTHLDEAKLKSGEFALGNWIVRPRFP